MKKKPTATVSLPEEPSDIVFTPEPLIFRLTLPPVDILTDFHNALSAIRKLPSRDPAREIKIDEAVKKYRDYAPQAWCRDRDSVMHGQKKENNIYPDLLSGLAEGNPRPFLRFARDYGPRGLALMLADEEILGRVEEWWVESILGNGALRKNLEKIGKELARAGARGSKKKNLPEESEQKEKASNRQSTQDRRALLYYDRAWNIYTKETKGVRDASTLWRIARDMARKECARGKEAKQEGMRLFLQRVKQDLAGRTVRVNSHTFPT